MIFKSLSYSALNVLFGNMSMNVVRDIVDHPFEFEWDLCYICITSLYHF